MADEEGFDGREEPPEDGWEFWSGYYSDPKLRAQMEENSSAEGYSTVTEVLAEMRLERTRIVMENLPHLCTEEDIRNLLEGTLGSPSVLRVVCNTRRNNKATVEFYMAQHAAEAVQAFQGYSFRGSPLRVWNAAERPSSPSVSFSDGGQSKQDLICNDTEEELHRTCTPGTHAIMTQEVVRGATDSGSGDGAAQVNSIYTDDAETWEVPVGPRSVSSVKDDYTPPGHLHRGDYTRQVYADLFRDEFPDTSTTTIDFPSNEREQERKQAPATPFRTGFHRQSRKADHPEAAYRSTVTGSGEPEKAGVLDETRDDNDVCDTFLMELQGFLREKGPLEFSDPRVIQFIRNRASPSVLASFDIWPLGAFRIQQGLKLVGKCICVEEDENLAISVSGGIDEPLIYKEPWEPLIPSEIRTWNELARYVEALLKEFGPLWAFDVRLRYFLLSLRPEWRTELSVFSMDSALLGSQQLPSLLRVGDTYFLVTEAEHRSSVYEAIHDRRSLL